MAGLTACYHTARQGSYWELSGVEIATKDRCKWRIRDG